MLFKRRLEAHLIEKIHNSNKVIILYGARQVGKTTMINNILRKLDLKICTVNGDERQYVDILSSRELHKLKLLTHGYDLLFIDEAQRIPDIGINLKILHDHFPKLKIVVTGSSSFNLAGKINEPLTGRTWTYQLFPFSINEVKDFQSLLEIQKKIEEYLIFGLYPEILHYNSLQEKERYLNELATSYLYKDILELSHIKHSDKLHNLLRLLAFQIGSEVSYHELGQNLSLSKETIASYIDLLEKSFVIFKLQAFSRNLKKEITKMHKIYFWDTGIRNILIKNMNFLSQRDDIGKLWENFLIAERMKFNNNRLFLVNSFFWRVYTGAELDYIEEKNNELFGYEIKYKNKRHVIPRTWISTYKNANYNLINKENFFDFITDTNIK